MKTQMKFQKILSLVSIIIVAIVFIYSLSFFSGNLADLLKYMSTTTEPEFTVADDFLKAGQAFIDSMITICIVFFCVIAVIYITSTNSRRNYYITNYVAIGLMVGMCLFVALYGIINIATLMGDFKALDWEAIHIHFEESYGMRKEVSQTTVNFVIGIVVFLIEIVLAAAWVLNLIWKKKLMDGEKALLAQAPVAEVINNEVAEEGV